MTQKELLYIEDAIGHECNLIKILEDTKNSLDDERLISFIEDEIDIHTNIKDNIINVLEDKANE